MNTRDVVLNLGICRKTAYNWARRLEPLGLAWKNGQWRFAPEALDHIHLHAKPKLQPTEDELQAMQIAWQVEGATVDSVARTVGHHWLTVERWLREYACCQDG